MENNQQPKPDSKGKAVGSLVLGVLAGIPAAFLVLFTEPYTGSPADVPGWTFITAIPFFILTMGPGLLGLVFGIKGLSSTKRNFAVAGVLISIIDLSYYLWLFYRSIVILAH